MRKSVRRLGDFHGIRGTLVLCLIVVGVSACSRSNALLEQPALMPGQPVGSLVMPPADVLAKADPNAPAAKEVDPCATGFSGTDGNADCAPPLVANDKDIASALQEAPTAVPASQRVAWRGKTTAGGIDIVNASGVLCSGQLDEGQQNSYFGKRITLACSDGSVGYLAQGNGTGATTLQINGQSEKVVVQQ